MYSEKCLELAQEFLKLHPKLNTEGIQDELAQYIEDTIEDFIRDFEEANQEQEDEEEDEEKPLNP